MLICRRHQQWGGARIAAHPRREENGGGRPRRARARSGSHRRQRLLRHHSAHRAWTGPTLRIRGPSLRIRGPSCVNAGKCVNAHPRCVYVRKCVYANAGCVYARGVFMHPGAYTRDSAFTRAGGAYTLRVRIRTRVRIRGWVCIRERWVHLRSGCVHAPGCVYAGRCVYASGSTYTQRVRIRTPLAYTQVSAYTHPRPRKHRKRQTVMALPGFIRVNEKLQGSSGRRGPSVLPGVR